VLEKFNNVKPTPLVLLLITTGAVLNFANSARGETTDPASASAKKVLLEKSTDLANRLKSEERGGNKQIVPDAIASRSQQSFWFSQPQAKIATVPESLPEQQAILAWETPTFLAQSDETPTLQLPGDTPSEPPSQQQTPSRSRPQTPRQAPQQTPTPQQPVPQTPAPEQQTPQQTIPQTPTEQPQTPPPAQVPQTPTPETPAPQIPTPEDGESPAPDGGTQEPSGEEARVLVAEVLVSGADRELTDLVYNTIRTRPGRTATRSQLQEDINAIYGTGFFANVRVTPEDTPLGVRVTFAVEPNPVLQRVEIQTVPETQKPRVLPDKVIEDAFKNQYGKILNLRDLQESIKNISGWYAQNGYDLAQVVESPQVSPDGTVTIIIAEGVIENIQVRYFDEEDEPVEGNTRPFIVTREVQLKPGDVFNRNTAQRDLQRVFGLGIFEDARFSFSPGKDPRQVVVNVDIVEGNTGSLAAGAGISSNSGLFGTASYQEQNLGGNNQTLGAELQIGEREFLFDVSFTDPWIGGDPYRTSYTINAFRRRSISLVFDGDDTRVTTERGGDSPRVVRTGGGITFTRPLAKDPYSRPDWRLSAGLTYQRVQIENGDGDISPRTSVEDGLQNLAFDPSGQDDLFVFSFGATQDSRNNSQQPTSGSLLRLGMEQTVPIGSGSILFNRLRASYSYYIPVDYINFGFTDEELPQALAFNVQAGTVLGDLPPYEAFVIGGSNSVRGYGEGEVGVGRSYFQASAEYRFPILSFIGAAVFLDYGTTLGSSGGVPGRPGEFRDLPGSGFGYGLGVRVQSPVGPIRIDYGWNDDGDSQIHFGIGERF
jgi:outer membrane protein insertion porin family